MKMNTREREAYHALAEVDAIQERMYEENSAAWLRYTKRVTARAWIRYSMKEARFRCRLAALRECKKWHDEGKVAYIMTGGQAVTCYEYYITHE